MNNIPFSMCPGGAMMLCEDVSEYDSLLPPNSNLELVGDDFTGSNRVSPHTDKPMSRTILTEDDIKPHDPVERLRGGLGKFYNNDIRELLNMQIPTYSASPEELDTTITFISDMACRVAHVLRKAVVKGTGQLHVMDSVIGGSFGARHEYLRSNLRTLILNRDKIIQGGFEKVQIVDVNLKILDTITPRAVDMFKADSSILCRSFTDRQFALLFSRWEANPTEKYKDLFDLVDCLYCDPARCGRHENTDSLTYSLDEFTSELTSPTATLSEYNREENLNSGALTLLSMMLRYVRIGAYDLSCDIIDGKVTDHGINSRCIELMYMIINTFAIVSVELYYNAYRLKKLYAINDGIVQHVDDILSFLKSD